MSTFIEHVARQREGQTRVRRTLDRVDLYVVSPMLRRCYIELLAEAALDEVHEMAERALREITEKLDHEHPDLSR